MKIKNEILAILESCPTNGNELHLEAPLDAKTYKEVNKVIEACGGKWNRGKKRHIFDTDAAERIEQVLLTGEVEVPKDEFGFFPTPELIVKRMLAEAGDLHGQRVLEPSAGVGNIAIPCLKAGAQVTCYEIAQKNFSALSQAIIDTPGSAEASQIDFLSVPPEPKFDLVIMNPPFGKQADIKHVSLAHSFLKPKGKLVAIMSAGITFRQNKLTKDFLGLVNSKGGTIEPLPPESFKVSGTSVNTVLVVIPA